MLNKVDMLIWNLLIIALFSVIIFCQVAEINAYVDEFGNFFKYFKFL